MDKMGIFTAEDLEDVNTHILEELCRFLLPVQGVGFKKFMNMGK